jgi:membrane protein DedA with SNARE-associated domain
MIIKAMYSYYNTVVILALSTTTITTTVMPFSFFITNDLIESITSWIANFGYPAVFLVALLETIFPPIPSELIFPLVGFTAQDKQLGIANAIGMAIVGASGSTIGAIIIYFISLKFGKVAILRFGKYVRINELKLQKAQLWFEKYGVLAVFTGRLAPGVREIISVPAGIGRMNLLKFIVFTFVGSSIWSISLTLMGYYVGKAWSKLSEQLSLTFSIIAIIVIGAISIAIIIRYKVINTTNKNR